MVEVILRRCRPEALRQQWESLLGVLVQASLEVDEHGTLGGRLRLVRSYAVVAVENIGTLSGPESDWRSCVGSRELGEFRSYSPKNSSRSTSTTWGCSLSMQSWSLVTGDGA